MANNDLSPKNTNFDDDEVTYVITRTGRKELLNTHQITKRLQTLINRAPKIPHVNPYDLMLEVCRGLKSGISTYEIDEYAANASASLSVSNPHYLSVAARIAIDNHQKNTMRSFVDKMRKAYLNVDDEGKVSPLINEDFFKYVEEHQDFIEATIDYNRDFLFDFFGFRTFQKSYSTKVNDKPIERPQDMYMRTAIALNMNTELDIAVEHANIKETYDLLSLKFYTHASPTYYNTGGQYPQYASCFLLGTGDSLEEIEKTGTDMSRISKRAGGIGVHINPWRSTGSRIRGTNGKSSGIVPFLRSYETRMLAFNQGGRRPGSAAIYIMPHHPDLLRFLALRRNDGIEKERARDLFYALWIPDIFMERVESNGVWSFFDSDHCGDLSNLHGTEYKDRYIHLEYQKKYKAQMPAREIWQIIKEVEQDTGMPYICFSDTVNAANMQSHLGTIKSSNLCTEIALYSDTKEYAVCVLVSISLPAFVVDGYTPEELTLPEEQRRPLNHTFPVNPAFDFRKLLDVVKVVVRNLNHVVDKTYHPVIETKRSNERHRPLGIGVQGLADAYAKMRFPFDSPEAYKLNKEIFEAIYFAALTASSVLSRKKYNMLKAKCKAEGSVTVDTYKPDDYETYKTTYTDPNDIPKKVAAFPSMEWNGGSPIAKGTFHWEMYDINPAHLSGMFDWESLKSHIQTFGVCNSHVVALMPTASTSQLLGNNECFEPYTSNVYKRDTSAGEFIVINKYLINDLYNSGLWNNNLKEYLIASEGSIQNIEGIPEFIKALYKTAWEIDPSVLIQQCIDRQPYVDQMISFNLYIRDFTLTKWNKCMFMAWRGRLKTGKYYLHTEAAVMPTKFTIDPSKQKEMAVLLEKNKPRTEFLSPLREVCDACTA